MKIPSQRSLHSITIEKLDTQVMYARARLVRLTLLLNLMVIVIIAISMVINYINVHPSLIIPLRNINLMAIFIHAIILDTSHKIVDHMQSPSGYWANKVTLLIGITIQGLITLHVDDMVTLQPIVRGFTLEEDRETRGIMGWRVSIVISSVI